MWAFYAYQKNILRHLAVTLPGTCLHQTHAELPLFKCQGSIAHERNRAQTLLDRPAVHCWIFLHAIVNIKHLFWHLNRRKKKKRRIPICNTALHAQQEWTTVLPKSKSWGERFWSFQLFPSVRGHRKWCEALLLRQFWDTACILYVDPCCWSVACGIDGFWGISPTWWLLL